MVLVQGLSPVPAAPSEPRRRLRKSFFRRRVVQAVLIVLLLIVVAVGVLAAVLASGPIRSPFLRGQIENSIRAALGEGFDVEVAGATIATDPELGLMLLLDGLDVRDSSETLVAEIPSIRLGLNLFALVTPGGVVRSVEVTDAKVAFVRGSSGRVEFGALGDGRRLRLDATPPSGAVPTGGFPDIVGALQILDRGIEPAINAAENYGFRSFSMLGTTIEFRDENLATLKTFTRTDLVVVVEPDSGLARATFSSLGYSGRWSATADRSLDAASGDRVYSVGLSQISLGDFLWNFADPNSAFSSDVPLYGRAMVRLAPDGAVRDANLRIDLGEGTMRFRSAQNPLPVDEATLKLRWDVANEAIIIEPSTLFMGDTRAVFTGSIRAAGEGRYDFTVESRGAVLAHGDAVGAAPLVTQRILVAGSADMIGRLVTIDNAMILAPTGSVVAAGSVGFDGASPSLALAAEFSPMPLDTLKQMWPPFLADGARRWVAANVTAGRLTSGRLEAAIPSGLLWNGQRLPIPAEALRLDMEMDGVSFRPLGEVPPIIGTTGHLALAGSTFGLDLEGGYVAVPSGRRVDVIAAAFAIPNTAPRAPDAQVVAQLSGSAGGLAEIANSEPLRALGRRGMDPLTFSGTGQASVSAKFPLRADVTEAEVDWRVTGNVANFSSTERLEGHTVAEANASLVITPQTLEIRGRARLDGLVTDLNMTQPLGGDVSVAEGVSQLRFVVGEETRDLLANGLQDILAGTIAASITDLEGREGQHFDLDLTEARLMLGPLGWSKGVGVPARLTFDLVPIANGFRVERVNLAGNGFGMIGTAELDSGYALRSANMTRVALRSTDDFALQLTRRGAGYAIAASGRSFDARGVLAELRGSAATGPSSAGLDLAVSGTIGRLAGFGQESLTNASVAFDFSGGVLREFRLSGSAEGAPLSLVYLDNTVTASLDLSAADGGRAFRFVDLYSNLAGGQLQINARRTTPDGPLAGTYDLANFRVVNEAGMQSLFASSGITATETVNGNNVPFDRMVVSFAKYGSVVALGEGLIRGNIIGSVFDGSIDMNGGRLALSGTYIPSYRLNNFFGQIPLFGIFLGGGSREGLLGVTFKIEGTMDAPLLTVNALSAIAPGIFRKLFEFN
ncbi:MAG: hypothetical protein IT535_11105 [Bauldia sp.]|nr:hypothetical protein [Bauldia sp.]